LAGFIYIPLEKMDSGSGTLITILGGGHQKIKIFFLTFIYIILVAINPAGVSLKTLTLRHEFMNILTKLGKNDELYP
jgi:hypothetical protein